MFGYLGAPPKLADPESILFAGIMSTDALHSALPGPPGSSNAGPSCSATLPSISLPSPLPPAFESEDFFFSVDYSAVNESVGCLTYLIEVASRTVSLRMGGFDPLQSTRRSSRCASGLQSSVAWLLKEGGLWVLRFVQGELLSVPLKLTSPSVVYAEVGSNFVVDFVRSVVPQRMRITLCHSLFSLRAGFAPLNCEF